MNSQNLKFSLIENSHNFLIEAVQKAAGSKLDIHQWKFAILNLVQALELTLKEVLRREHPILIYENIDSPQNTVSISQALARIENDKIIGISFSNREKRKIRNAVLLRNKITHFEFQITAEYAMSKFSELFAFLVYFQSQHLKIEIDEVLGHKDFNNTLEIDKCFKELKQKALQRIEEEGLSAENIWLCPNCEEDTFVIEDGQDVCFLCRYAEKVIECPHCGNICFAFEIESFHDMIETEYEEGITSITNNYGYEDFNACPKCIGKIREKIENQREEEYCHFLDEQEWYEQNQGK